MIVNKLTLEDSSFPSSLREIVDPPKQLFILGNPSLIKKEVKVGVVGSRRVSSYGRSVTLRLARELAEQDIVIVSGLALGIDSIAHRAALEVKGKTIAVLPCGLDRVYPASHTTLAKEILSNDGLLISEYPPGTNLQKYQFIARNRLISGLSDGVLITEAASKSGSLHTANFALDQGKQVFAVPGNITSDLSAGTNNLIRAGATPVTGSNDIFEALNLAVSSSNTPVADNAEEALLLNLLQQGVQDSSELLEQSRMDTARFNQTLTMLEISGKIRPLGTGQWGLK